MKPNSLEKNKGLSLSQAQSISNLCNQRANEISNKLSKINNYSKTITYDGEQHVLEQGVKIPENIVELLQEKSKLHACQAFLMENINAKQIMLDDVKYEEADISEVAFPESPQLYNPDDYIIKNVDEEYGWEQLKTSEYNDYLEAEAYASHIGQFIHNNSKLNNLRNELVNVPSIEWMEIETGKKTPIQINVHHTSDELMKIHEELASLHRKYEQRVNYYKAKVKNIVTEENSRIASENSKIRTGIEEKNNEIIQRYNS
ncbi:MAG: hypothetical protein ACOC2U_02115, partial [bacterium]